MAKILLLVSDLAWSQDQGKLGKDSIGLQHLSAQWDSICGRFENDLDKNTFQFAIITAIFSLECFKYANDPKLYSLFKFSFRIRKYSPNISQNNDEI